MTKTNSEMAKPGKIQAVLLIDDDIDDFDFLREAFKEIDSSIQVYHVQKCSDVLAYAKQHIDLIFLDVNMPVHDGFDWLKVIRERGMANRVVMYTNSTYPLHVTRAYEDGADLYFSKPVSFSTLKTGIGKIISRDWSGASLATFVL